MSIRTTIFAVTAITSLGLVALNSSTGFAHGFGGFGGHGFGGGFGGHSFGGGGFAGRSFGGGGLGGQRFTGGAQSSAGTRSFAAGNQAHALHAGNSVPRSGATYGNAVPRTPSQPEIGPPVNTVPRLTQLPQVPGSPGNTVPRIGSGSNQTVPRLPQQPGAPGPGGYPGQPGHGATSGYPSGTYYRGGYRIEPAYDWVDVEPPYEPVVEFVPVAPVATVAPAAVAAPVAPPGTVRPCTCLTKEYTVDAIVFRDVCTQEVAMVPLPMRASR